MKRFAKRLAVLATSTALAVWPAIAIVLLLAGCVTNNNVTAAVGVPGKLAYPPVPDDIARCVKSRGVEVPQRELTEAEVERLWKTDRVTIDVVRKCLGRLVARDNKLAKP